MESFFLSETTKYLYLLFDEENFLHNDAAKGEIIKIDDEGGECVINSGPYIFNTEAHPVDASALYCCHDHKQDIFDGLELQNFSDSALAKADYELNIKDKTDNNVYCSKTSAQRDRYKKTVQPPPSTTPSKSDNQPSLAVDIEVFDEDNKPAGDILVESFERVKNELTASTRSSSSSSSTTASANIENHRNQLTVSDLQDFFSKRRENFKSPQDILDYTVAFLKNFTLDPAYISSLQLFDKRIYDLLGSVTQKEYEGTTRTIWELYELHHRFQMNMNFLVEFKFHLFGDFNRQMIDKVLLVLNGDQSDSSNNFIWNKLTDLYMEYTRSLTNTTAMQNLLLKILINGSDEKQRAYKAFLTTEEISKLPIETVDVSEQLKLFSYAKRIIDAEKRMSDRLEQLQKLMVDIDKKQIAENKRKLAETAEYTAAPSTAEANSDVEKNDDLFMPMNKKSKVPSVATQNHSSNHSSSSGIGTNLMHSTSKENDNISGSVWSHLVDTFLGKSSHQKSKFDAVELLQRTRKSLDKNYNNVNINYSLLTCSRPKFIESFAYRYYYP